MEGIHPSITLSAIVKFENWYESSPDAFQLANPNPYGTRKGYFSEPEPITFVGQVVECDYLEPDVNDVQSEQPDMPEVGTGRTGEAPSSKTKRKRKNNKITNEESTAIATEETFNPATKAKKTAKFASLGGAMYGFVSIDRYSRYIMVKLLIFKISECYQFLL